MADVQLGSVQAAEAIAHLRGKVGVPIKRWDDLLGSVRAKAFAAAGATKAELVNDLHGSVIDALEQGQSIGDFRRAFDDIVAKHGWTYRGSRGWRTRTIYDNNLRSAHMAGRWEQVQRTKARRPYLIYMTVGDARVRAEHRQWHGIALPIDDSWWDSHFPPNDFGCRCYVITASARDLERMGIKVLDAAPEIKTTRRINTRTGEDYGDVPEGIGTGWNYNVGKAWLGSDVSFGQTLAKLPRTLRKEIGFDAFAKQTQASFAVWADRALTDIGGRGYVHTIGYLDDTLLSALEERSHAVDTATVTIDDHRLRRMLRPTKVRKALDLPDSVVRSLPLYIRAYQAVLLDRKNGGLVFVLPGNFGTGAEAGKLIVSVNFRERGEVTNSARSAGLTPALALRNEGNFEVIAGSLD